MVTVWCEDCQDVQYSINGAHCSRCMSRDVNPLACPECESDDLWPHPPMYEKYNVACTECNWKDAL